MSPRLMASNHNTSGTMDLFMGEETVDLIEGLFLSRQEDPLVLEEKHRDTFFAATPDVRDETVARFAANRFRRTFRSLRPLCEDDPSTSDESLMPALSRRALDHKRLSMIDTGEPSSIPTAMSRSALASSRLTWICIAIQLIRQPSHPPCFKWLHRDLRHRRPAIPGITTEYMCDPAGPP